MLKKPTNEDLAWLRDALPRLRKILDDSIDSVNIKMEEYDSKVEEYDSKVEEYDSKVEEYDGKIGYDGYDDLRVASDVVSEATIQGGPAPVKTKFIADPIRTNTFSGLWGLNFRGLPGSSFWQSCSFNVQLPHTWNNGTIYPHVHGIITNGTETTGKNLFDQENCLEMGEIRTNNGSDRASTVKWRSSCYIEVQPGLEYTISYSSGTTSNPVFYWYDDAKTYLGPSIGNDNGPTATAPNNASFARFVLDDATSEPTNVMLEQNNEATDYEPFGDSVVEVNVGDKLLFEFEYVWIPIHSPKDFMMGIQTINYEVKDGDLDTHLMIPFNPIDAPANPGVSSMILGRFSRIRKPGVVEDWQYPELEGNDLDNDDCMGDFMFLEWDYHYKINRPMGSEFETGHY